MLSDEIIDPEFINFAIEDFSEFFSYIASGRVNIRRYKEDGPPKRPAGKQDVVWGVVELNNDSGQYFYEPI